ncbi:hypothetical protein GEMRC1_006452 [Eukaryota sp. GEM-RC1]
MFLDLHFVVFWVLLILVYGQLDCSSSTDSSPDPSIVSNSLLLPSNAKFDCLLYETVCPSCRCSFNTVVLHGPVHDIRADFFLIKHNLLVFESSFSFVVDSPDISLTLTFDSSSYPLVLLSFSHLLLDFPLTVSASTTLHNNISLSSSFSSSSLVVPTGSAEIFFTNNGFLSLLHSPEVSPNSTLILSSNDYCNLLVENDIVLSSSVILNCGLNVFGTSKLTIDIMYFSWTTTYMINLFESASVYLKEGLLSSLIDYAVPSFLIDTMGSFDLDCDSSFQFSISVLVLNNGTFDLGDGIITVNQLLWNGGSISGNILNISGDFTASNTPSFGANILILSSDLVIDFTVFFHKSVLEISHNINVTIYPQFFQFTRFLDSTVNLKGTLHMPSPTGLLYITVVFRGGHLHCTHCSIRCRWFSGSLSGTIVFRNLETAISDTTSPIDLRESSQLIFSMLTFTDLYLTCGNHSSLSFGNILLRGRVSLLNTDPFGNCFVQVNNFANLETFFFYSELPFFLHGTLALSVHFFSLPFLFCNGVLNIDQGLTVNQISFGTCSVSGNLVVTASLLWTESSSCYYTKGILSLETSYVQTMAIGFAESTVLKIPVDHSVIIGSSSLQFNNELFKGILVVEGSLFLLDGDDEISVVQNSTIFEKVSSIVVIAN